ncbi:DMP19 family protein [Aquimarina pacifica]|uniref:DMP19 family protein n=1 Tax=Aquimarina pacifica TaxID=1296415 RepID=UPI000470299D|nr:DUF4375 domain-containing protein [Aquimarina pacifica]
METLIEKIVLEHSRAIKKRKFSCFITIKDGGISGNYYYNSMLKKRKKGDVSELGIENNTLYDLPHKLGSLKNELGLSPHKFTLEFDETKQYDYQIYYPDLKDLDVSTTKSESDYFYPHYIYINITKDLITQLDGFDLDRMIPLHIDQAKKILQFESDIAYTKSISEEFYLFMLNHRIQGELESGGFDHLYAVFKDDPSDLIIDMHSSFRLLKNTSLLDIFSESIQLYAHFHENVEKARLELDIPAIEKQTGSDIQNRYYQLESSLKELRISFIKGNPEKFEKIVVNV